MILKLYYIKFSKPKKVKIYYFKLSDIYLYQFRTH